MNALVSILIVVLAPIIVTLALFPSVRGSGGALPAFGRFNVVSRLLSIRRSRRKATIGEAILLLLAVAAIANLVVIAPAYLQDYEYTAQWIAGIALTILVLLLLAPELGNVVLGLVGLAAGILQLHDAGGAEAVWAFVAIAALLLWLVGGFASFLSLGLRR